MLWYTAHLRGDIVPVSDLNWASEQGYVFIEQCTVQWYGTHTLVMVN